MKICLIGCVKRQEENNKIAYKAEELYKSWIYKKCLQEAKNQKPDKIFILSTKYELLHLHTMIYPYNFPKLGISHEQYLTNNKNLIKENREKWINNVLEQIKKEGIKLDEKFLFYASNMFYKALSPILMNSFKKINCRTGELCR